MTAARSIQIFAKDIKLGHSIFALPFALSALTFLSIPSLTFSKIVMIIGCMVCARSFAMGMNRYIDRDIDVKNPRTVGRMIPAALITARESLGWSLLFGLLFVFLAFGLSKLAGILSIPLLFVLAGYSYQKRYTWMCHLYLGMCLGFAPVAVEIALSGTVTLPIFFIGVAVTFWTAGFDIIYSLQDRDFDGNEGLHSAPQRFGYARAIDFSRLFFLCMILALSIAGFLADSGWIYFVGTAAIATILFCEHFLIKDAKKSGHSKYINKAFFDFNAFVAVFFFAISLADVLVK